MPIFTHDDAEIPLLLPTRKRGEEVSPSYGDGGVMHHQPTRDPTVRFADTSPSFARGGKTLVLAMIASAFASAVFAQQTWVAVADDGGRYFGYAVGMDTREAAEGAAIGSCGASCAVKMTALARCVAYARSDTGNAAGYAAGASLDVVRQMAWDDCNRRVPANSCTIRAAQCFE